MLMFSPTSACLLSTRTGVLEREAFEVCVNASLTLKAECSVGLPF